MRRRDKLLPWRFRPKSDSSNASQTSSPVVQSTTPSIIPSTSSTQSLQATSTTRILSANGALELAIQKHLDKITDAEKEAFRDASKTIDEENLLSKARACDDTHKQKSSFRPQAERLAKFLNLLNRFMGGIAIGIQASPEISSLVVGAVRIVIDLAIDFVEFFSRLADMLCQFEDYLEPLADFAKASQDFMLVQRAVADIYGDLLDFCQKARRVFVDTNGNERKWTSWRVFMRQQWEPFETGFGPIKINMQHHIDVLRLTGQAQQLHNDRETAQERRQIERENFLEWISKVDFETVHDNIYAKKHRDTGGWLIQKKEFKAWFGSSKSSLLWCYGKPGAGKSVLASNVLEHITTKHALDENVAICFAYYNYRTPQDYSQIVAALMKQLCRTRDTIPPRLLKLKRDSFSSSSASTQESFIMLTEELHFEEIYVVIDALDECPQRERHHIIGFITGIMKALRCAKIFITSRRESDIIRAFEESNTPTIQIKAENVARDIEAFVRSEVQKLRNGYHGKKLYLTSDALEAKVIQTLTENAAGMFLWVNLQLENLCQISEAQQDRLVENALDSLPQGLDETYTRIVERIDDQPKYQKELALNCLIWTIYARRPLRTQELQDALALMADNTCQKQIDIVVDKVEVILQACGNLLVHENDAIRPVHYSVQEFFTKPSSKVPQRSIQETIADPEVVQKMLSSVCLRYLQLGSLTEPCHDPSELYYRVKSARFISYAAQYFDYHLSRCKTLPVDILELVESLLQQDGDFFAAIVQMRNIQDPFDYRSIYPDFNPVSYAVSADTVIYGSHLYEIDHIRTRLVGRIPPEYALHQAALGGLIHAVERLTEQGCSIDERDGKGASPIYYASIRGHTAAVELLLSKGADVNAQGGDPYDNVLAAASSGGHTATVELLLSKGADVNAQGDGYYANALIAASARGYTATVELLLSKGADVNTEGGGDYANALTAASLGGHKAIVELLLSKGADVNAQGGDPLDNALTAASLGGHTATVELLLSKGADVNAQGGGYYANALIAASARRRTATVELLLIKGADVNAQGGGHYANALTAASSEGHTAAIELLLSKGAEN